MQLTYAAPRARLGPAAVVALVLATLGLLLVPAAGEAAAGTESRDAAREIPAMASAGWHGRAIRRPRPRPQLVRTGWPAGWAAGSVGPGTGFVKPGGSDRVRDVQRRLVQLGYRPGPVDGLFGPRTRAAVRWFQYKHGLDTAGRVNRSTLAVLHARSDHEPLRTEQRSRQPDVAEPAGPPPSPTPASTPVEDGTDYSLLVLALLLALGLGVIVGLLGPELRRAFRTVPDSAANAAVLGYAAVETGDTAAETATAALAHVCAQRGWSLVEVVHDGHQPDRRLAERRGLVHALRELRKGTAQGLVVARLRDVGPRIADLATLLHWLEEANAFLAAADHDLDTSTEDGRATARAIVELGAWERRNTTESERKDLAKGRFTSRAANPPDDLAEQLAAMLERGIPPRAVTDALVLAGLADGARDAETMTKERRWT